MTGRLSNRVAIVTGGASGFGSGIVECFAREGAKVLIGDLDEARGTAMCETVEKSGGIAAFERVDVSRSVEVANLVATCDSLFGGVDIMVANAGLGQRPCPIEDMDEEEYDRIFEVNVKGVYYCAKHVLPVFRRQGHGNIIVTASGIALTPRPNLVVYGATKGAVVTFVKGLAMELATEGFRVNALCPAAGDTPMLAEFMGGKETREGRERFRSGLPLGKLITPADMGNAAVFLASETEAATITGAAFPIDSGRCI